MLNRFLQNTPCLLFHTFIYGFKMSLGLVLILGIELYILLAVCLYGLLCFSFIQLALKYAYLYTCFTVALLRLNP